MSLKDIMLGRAAKPTIFGGRTHDQAILLGRAARYGSEGLKSIGLAFGTPEAIESSTAARIARAQAQREARFAGAGFEDARRRLKSLLAQRGQTGTSLGLGQEVALQKQQAQQRGDILASIPERAREIYLKQGQAFIQGAAGTQGLQGGSGQLTMMGKKTGLLPGLLAAGGAAVGGIFGGPMGAAAGARAGAGTGQAISGTFQS